MVTSVTSKDSNTQKAIETDQSQSHRLSPEIVGSIATEMIPKHADSSQLSGRVTVPTSPEITLSPDFRMFETDILGRSSEDLRNFHADLLDENYAAIAASQSKSIERFY